MSTENITPVHEEFVVTLRAEKKRLGLTWEQLARVMHVTHGCVITWVARPPKSERVRAGIIATLRSIPASAAQEMSEGGGA